MNNKELKVCLFLTQSTAWLIRNKLWKAYFTFLAVFSCAARSADTEVYFAVISC